MAEDFNRLERAAAKLISEGLHRDAVKIYYYMADGDPSLDVGYLGMQIGTCYENLGDLQAALYWYGRAVEENPAIEKYLAARQRLAHVSMYEDEGVRAAINSVPRGLLP